MAEEIALSTNFPGDAKIDVKHVNKELGRGSYGVVTLGRWHGTDVAVKRLHPHRDDGIPVDLQKAFDKFVAEWDFHRSLQHPHIVQFLGVCDWDEDHIKRGLVTERLHSTLYERYSQQPFLTYRQTVNIGENLASALSYMHAQSLSHRDLTTKNILLTSFHDPSAKVADVGQARYLIPAIGSNGQAATVCPGNRDYMPREALVATTPDGQACYGCEIDIFCFGVVSLAVLVRKEPGKNLRNDRLVDGLTNSPGPTSNTCEIMMVREVKRRAVDLDEVGSDHPLYPIITRCLNDSPSRRPKADELCRELTDLKQGFCYRQLSQTRSRGSVCQSFPNKSAATLLAQIASNPSAAKGMGEVLEFTRPLREVNKYLEEQKRQKEEQMKEAEREMESLQAKLVILQEEKARAEKAQQCLEKDLRFEREKKTVNTNEVMQLLKQVSQQQDVKKERRSSRQKADQFLHSSPTRQSKARASRTQMEQEQSRSEHADLVLENQRLEKNVKKQERKIEDLTRKLVCLRDDFLMEQNWSSTEVDDVDVGVVQPRAKRPRHEDGAEMLHRLSTNVLLEHEPMVEWQQAADLPCAVMHNSKNAAVADGVLYIGGLVDDSATPDVQHGQDLQICLMSTQHVGSNTQWKKELFSAKDFEKGAPGRRPIGHVEGLVSLNNKLLIVGQDQEGRFAIWEKPDQCNVPWKRLKDLKLTPNRERSGLVLFGKNMDQLAIIGGEALNPGQKKSVPQPAVDVIDMSENRCFRQKNLPGELMDCEAVFINNRIYALGGVVGFNEKEPKAYEKMIFAELSNEDRSNVHMIQGWREVEASAYPPQQAFAAEQFMNKLVVVGGVEDSSSELQLTGKSWLLSSTQEEILCWRELPSLRTPRMWPRLVTFHNTLVCFGGQESLNGSSRLTSTSVEYLKLVE